MGSWEIYFRLVGQQNKDKSFRVSTFKNKNIDHQVKPVLLCQHICYIMRLTTSVSSVIQQCQVTKFLFCVFFCNLKEKDCIRRNINGKKKEIFLCEISIIILICQELGLVGPLQQKINLPSPKYQFVSIKYWFTLTNTN